jgi:hypothetical protein
MLLPFIILLLHFIVSRWTDSYSVNMGDAVRKLKAVGGGETVIKIVLLFV